MYVSQMPISELEMRMPVERIGDKTNQLVYYRK